MSSALFEHLGPYARQPPVADCCHLTERVWDTYNDLAQSRRLKEKESFEFLIQRMLYLAETTSAAIRLNASWGLTLPAMSLFRDRYEQTLRFSWLVRNPDPQAFEKYDRTKFAKMGDLVRSTTLETREHFEKRFGSIPQWATEPLTKDQHAFFEEWSKLDLRSMGSKRDGFPPLTDHPVAKEQLGHWYDKVYSQFSAVSHYERYSIELLTVSERDGRTVLGAGEHWPRTLILMNAQFDIIQCFEAAFVCHRINSGDTFNAFLVEWVAVAKQITDLNADWSPPP